MRLTLALLLGCALLGASGRADAYPQFQLSTDNDTCTQCHLSPGGGGLINDYGRDEAGSTLSMWQVRDGRFLHGLWTPPAALQLGGDIRLATVLKDEEVSGAEVLAFPMQSEIYVRPKVGPVSLYVAAGVRGTARNQERDLGDRLASREHYVMYEHGAWYLRGGRFFPVFGIRTQDHTRRHLGAHTLEEPYGVAWGTFASSSELHVSAFTKAPSPFLGTAQDSGIAAYWERRNEEVTAAMALQARATVSKTDRRFWLGGVYKRWLAGSKLMVLAELDVGAQDFDDAPADSDAADPSARLQLVSYLGVTYMARQGLMVSTVAQAYDPDLALQTSSRTALELDVQWFPIAHVELHLLTRAEAVGLDVDAANLITMLQLHYYL